MKRTENAASFEGFLRRLPAACLKTGEDKAAQKDPKMASLRASLL